MTLQDFIDFELGGFSVVRWASILVVVLFTVVVMSTIKRFVMRRITALSEEHEDLEWLNYVEAMFGRPKPFLYLAVGLFAGITAFPVGEEIAEKTMSVVQVCVILQLGVWVSGAANLLMLRFKAAAEDDPAQITALSAVDFVLNVVVWSMVALLALANLGFDITALVASLGIGGVALALASQSILGDLLAFFSIIVDKPFLKGDFVVVGAFSGSIEHIGIKTTRIRSLHGEQVIFSNQDLLQSRIRNFKRMENRRVVVEFGVAYNTPLDDLEAIPEIVAGVVEGLTSDDAPVDYDRTNLTDFGESSLQWETVYSVLSPDFRVHMDIRQAVILGVLRELRARDVEIAFPTQTVHIAENRRPDRPVQAGDERVPATAA
jgi:small-conductance mechanosensitive channel